MSLSDDALIATFVEAAADVSDVGVGLWQTFASAARVDAHVRAAFDSTLQLRRAEFDQVIALLDARGMIANDRPRDELAAALVFLASAEGYQHFVLESGLSRQRYREWLTHAIGRLILAA